MQVGGYKRRDDDPVVLDGYVISETEKAIAFSFDEYANKGTWLPKSQLSDIVYQGSAVSCKCPEWLAKERKLI